ncbi:hypothetical protein ACHAW6_016017 [Cyclotella cf. meneghiniana]
MFEILKPPLVSPSILFLLASLVYPLPSHSFQPSLTTAAPATVTTRQTLQASKQTYIYDGGELQSFLLYSNRSNPSSLSSSLDASDSIGCVTFVTSQTSNGKCIGVLASSSSSLEVEQWEGIDVYKHTVAKIPVGISDNDAMSTAAACLVGIHCGAPRVVGVGGSGEEEGFYSGKAVVVGGNEYASFLAEGLAVLGIETFLVSNGAAKMKQKGVKIMKPAVTNDEDDDEIGFAAAIGRFDSLIDTIANERKGSMISDDGGSSVIELLQSKHQCNKYISTLSKSQNIVKKEGVIFGPGKANAHVKSLSSQPSNVHTNGAISWLR